VFGGLAIALPRHGWNQPAVAFSIALAFVGLMLLVSTWVGRARGLILVGLLLVPPFLISHAVGGRWNDIGGSRVARPTTVSALQDDYQWGIGARTLDLRGLDLGHGHQAVRVDQSIGALRVHLPPDAVTHVDARVSGGDIVYQLDGAKRSDGSTKIDPPPEADGVGAEASPSLTTGSGAATLDLNIHLTFGHLVIIADDVTEVAR
jgi:hypothetical protein